MALTVGIDLGTTYSVIAYVDTATKKPEIIKIDGQSTVPSMVGFLSDGDYVIGEDAKQMAEEGDVNTAAFYKLHMGDRQFRVQYYGREYTACDLSSLFLKRLVEKAEEASGQRITRAVITVPAYFEDRAKSDTLKAGNAAGLEVLNIISEPTAACVAYGLREGNRDKRILVYDLGGGTFDVTIAAIKKNSIDVLATNGNHQLGGRDWDIAISDWLNEQFVEATGMDISGDDELMAANMVKAEQAKRQLSTAKAAIIKVDNGVQSCTFRLTREIFEDLTSYQLGRTTDLIDDTFQDISIQGRPLCWADLDGAILVGGSTKMPMVGNYIRKQGIPILQGVHPDEAVAIGAALQANISQFCAIALTDKNKSSLALSGRDQVNLTMLPGAKMIRDVISHSLGMIVSNEDETAFVNDIMIPRNTPVDHATETRTRALRVSRNQEKNKLDIYLLQGESENPMQCSIAKKYVFTGIEYEDGGTAMLDITFLHTINGTIDISAQQHKRPLNIEEEEIPTDMSWLERSPRELLEESQPTLTGAVILALDISYSMEGDTIAEAKRAMKNFVDAFDGSGIDIGVLAFSNKAAYACLPSKDLDFARRAIDSLECAQIGQEAPINAGVELGGGTSANPLPQLFDELRKYRGCDVAYAIVMTDGIWKKRKEAIAFQSKFSKAGLELVGMGFGAADISFLRNLSTMKELAKVDDIMALNENLSSIARIIQT